MARVNLFNFTASISNETVSTADDKNVHVDTKKDLPKQVQEDTDSVDVDKDVSAEASNTKTSEPGPADGGGDGTATFHTAEKAGTHVKITDVDPKVAHDQNGGREIDTLPNKVNAKDNLSARDVSTSVESHEDKSDSEESDLKTMDASGAEVVPEADDMVMDLESEEIEVSGLTDAADKGISEADAAIAKTNELNKAVASVERYVGLLNRLDEAGRAMSPELRQSISWALEAIDAELFFDERVALEAFDPSARVSLEANDLVASNGGRAGTIDDGEDPGTVSKGLSAKLKKIVEAAVRMFWRAVNAVQDAYQALTSNMPKLRDHLAELRSKVKVLEGGTVFQMKGVERLMVGDEFIGDSSEAIGKVSKISHELLMAWPNQLGKLLNEWKAGRGSVMNLAQGSANFAKLADEIDDLMKRAFRNLTPLTPADKDKVPSGFLNVEAAQWSGPLPGNRALYTGVENKGDWVSQANLTDSVRINFSLIPSAEARVNSVEVETIDVGEAIKIIRELEKLTHFIDDAKKGMAELKAFAGDITASGRADKYFGLLTGNEGAALAGQMIIGVAKATTESQNQFFGYVIGMIKAYMGYISASIKAEAGNGETIEGELAA